MVVRKQQGFTLIESVVAIIVLGISMSVLTTVLYPQIENSASSHYQVRASALASSMMSEILSRGFDENSDFNGGVFRCDEDDYVDTSVPIPYPKIMCTEESSFGNDGQLPESFNDVDDYIGCWYTNTTQSACTITQAGSLSDVLGVDITNAYPNFRVEVSVSYDSNSSLLTAQPAGKNRIFKKIELTVFPGKYSEQKFVAYRGNY